MANEQWKYDLEAYIIQGEPSQAEKSAAWKTAIGLQDVDGLKTSGYLLETAKDHIEGKIDIFSAEKRIRSYYEERGNRNIIESDTMEADIVSVRIAELLNEKTFQFSPAQLKQIHNRLFCGVFDHTGTFRTYNITKKEWVLEGETVYYASFDSIEETLKYDFEQEKQFSYADISVSDAIKHIAKFTSGIWQIHPFGEGNTRTTAVFVIKYLKTFGFDVKNDVFSDHSWYFRNALVRANYNDLKNNIHATTIFLERFFENLLLGASHELKNRFMHINYNPEMKIADQSAISKCQNEISKCQNVTLEEAALLKLIAANPQITQKRLAELTGKSERTIKRFTVSLQEKGFMCRRNGKRNGEWEILIEL